MESRIIPRFDRRSSQNLWRRVRFLLLGSLYYRLDEPAERYLGSFLGAGFVGLLGFVQRIFGAVTVVLNSALAAPTITSFSLLVRDGRLHDVKRSIAKHMCALLGLTTSMLVGLWLVGEEIFLLLFGDRVGGDLIPVLEVTLLALFAIVMARPVNQVLANTLLSLRKEKLLTLGRVISLTIALGTKVGLTLSYGVSGLLIGVVVGEGVKTAVNGLLVMRVFRTGVAGQERMRLE